MLTFATKQMKASINTRKRKKFPMMKKMLKRVWMGAMFLTLATSMSAQRYQSMYAVKNNKVTYDNKTIREADARSFQVLGYGYAKDRYNVYLDGNVLRFVDPQTFRVQGQPNNMGPVQAMPGEPQPGHGHGEGMHPGEPQPGNGYHIGDEFHGQYHPERLDYMITRNEVYFAGRRIAGASATTFKDLGEGYGKDAFDVYYYGEKIKGASASSFKVVGEGYSRDNFSAFFRGKEIKGSSGSTFKLIGQGYAKDAFDVYYYGEEIKGATPNSFKLDGNGYAHDAFHYYYYGKKVN